MIDRNLTVSYLIVDEMHQEHPELIKDQYWEEVFPNELPYTDESKRPVPPEPSTAKLGIARQSWEDKNIFKNNLLMLDSTHSFFSPTTSDPFIGQKEEIESSTVTFNDNINTSDTDNRIRSEIIILQPSPTSCKSKSKVPYSYSLIFILNITKVNLEELINQRKRERRERLRHRFLNIRSSHKTANSRYILTVLRPPSAGSSHHSIPEEGQEEEEKPETSDVPNSKQEKTD